ncbi:MAG: peptidoglycan-binding domain-containing protein [Burkholderiales bacterium]
MALSDYANWWDRERKTSEKALEEWVQENPQWWAIGVATFTSTAMELGAGMVDALRLGEGAAQGTVKGVATDAMRLLVLIGPLSKLGGVASGIARTNSIRLAVTTQGVTGPCTFTAVNNAASIASGSGRNFFLTAREAARALGKPLGSVAKVGADYKLAAWIDELIPFLTKQGVRLRNLGKPASLADVTAAAGSQNGVVVFAIKWVDAAGKTHAHSMIAARTGLGVQFADYGGKFMSSLSELAKRGPQWAATSGYSVYTTAAGGSSVLVEFTGLTGAMHQYGMQVFKGGMLLLEGAHALETPDGGVDLALEVTPSAVIANTHEPEVVKQSFEAFKARKEGKPLAQMRPVNVTGRRSPPPPPHLLTGVQYRLNFAGFGAGPVDGINGPKTKRATRQFQSTYDLVVDAIPGPKTQKKLVEVCGF